MEIKMKNNFETVIGIEVHVVLSSKTKMFSSSKSSHTDPKNTNISPIDLGHPGTMPLPNKRCIEKAIVLAKALDMEIEKNISFDRKNYFYQDLPKGFQITQQFHPIGKNGKIYLDENNFVDIERIHLEEDTAKQTKEDDGTILLDYNRSGIPLIEIVTKPCIKSSTEAGLFLKKLRRILTFNDISDAKMEEGSLRVDVNISVKPIGSKEFGTRVEIKNINSINNVEKAIEYESNLQAEQILKQEEVLMATKRFNDKTLTTEFMRLKTTNVDYHYMVEPNIFVRKISDDFITDVIKNNYTDIKSIEADLLKNNVSQEFINLLMDDYELFQKFKFINDEIKDCNEVIKWLCVEFVGSLNKVNLKLKDATDFQLNQLLKMMKYLLKDASINAKQGKEIVKLLIETNKDIDTLIEENNFKQITDKNVLRPILEKYVEANKPMLDQYDSRPERVEKFFIGMVMKDTNGQANPNVVTEIFNEILKLNK
ncbi:glutamyl-tRNA amidotransferase subunit B [Malacoplasma penetrans HF-2]|uniref:Aspartyl/glutamyl-tRNA(Asn/Gln) amidotransferase subunit B n=1 Tax=Malacoplasma penetrans (strain HF-2) TaxID=272633 RepID=GATB_MALP2|nr:Asp-tRNA(Asn)/Glu-tRNA(Gln) amidotransferase subunit GatB [Malacoplasma penetrans]Q8EWJ2.1 RecName: Full=Aspartyl/glutamyl-tRNA(Asn/Gln) amidotransferase subunit B; Short=Asp/Glu-ADT subunit B [Malacoplasma penetrans HF-2]BAC44002.1 glutamyl-tRNA amidotransferase subunit B [Malacoplasma penetrans HF-2]